MESATKERAGGFKKWLPSVESHFVDPPVRNLQPTKITSYGGDVLVRQVKQSERWRERSLASIKLGKIGRVSIVPDVWSNPQTGQARAVRHLCRVSRLPAYIPPGVFTIQVASGVMFATNSMEASMSTFHEGLNTIYEDYGDTWGSGETVVVGDGEYLQVESTEQRITLSWTSKVSLTELLKIVQADPGQFTELGTSDSFVKSTARADEVEWFDGTASDVINFVETKRPTVLYLSLEYASLVLAWTAPGKRVRGSRAEYAEVAIVLSKLDRDLASSLVQSTASPAVRDHFSELSSDIRQLASA
jgi:hypothetical protein